MKKLMSTGSNSGYTRSITLLLLIITLAVYSSLGWSDFINLDDPKYIILNSHVRSGVSLENIIWAFTTPYSANWHPLTWISHMVDVELFGMNPGYHHYTNLFFHLLNTLILFTLLVAMTNNHMASGITAALFSIHPMHVESVAWVSERKDVLSGFFFFITLWAYLYYTKSQNIKRYFLVLISFTLGLMAKPMLVTLPFILLLLDYWPLNRFFYNKSDSTFKGRLLKLSFEKVPLIALSLISSLITIYAQKSGGAVQSMEMYSLTHRLSNASVSYIQYIEKIFVPIGLAVYYPYVYYSLWYALVAVMILTILSAITIHFAKKYPYLGVGWLWFLGTLVPVIGLVQVGNQSMADRYSYIPSIGIFISLVWLIFDYAERRVNSRKIIAAATVFFLVGFSLQASRQVGLWKNSVTLYEHTLNVTKKNEKTHFLMGMALTDLNEIDRAIFHYKKALEINPANWGVHNNLGVMLAQIGNYKEAIAHFSKLVDSKNGNDRTHYNLALAYQKSGDLKNAELNFRKALRVNPTLRQAKEKLEELLRFN